MSYSDERMSYDDRAGYDDRTGYDDRAGYDDRRGYWEPPRRSFPIGKILLTIVILAGIGVAVYFVLDRTRGGGGNAAPTNPAASHSPSPSAQADPAAQAAAIDKLLDDSVAGRARLQAAIIDINACNVTSSTREDIQAAIDSRSNLIARLDALEVGAIPEGAALKTDLRAALSASYKADVAYMEWVQAAGTSCPRTTDSKFAAVTAANAEATQAKVAFVAKWNPVAIRYALTKTNRSASEI